VTIWIDPPQWPAHGRLWSHLISDTSLAELHAFAERTGIPGRGFEGDHYDIPAERYADVVAAGARETTGRDLLRRLRESGLRMSKRKGDTGIERFIDVAFPDGTRADVDLVGSAKEMPQERVFASMVFVRDAAGAHLVSWSERRQEWSACGGWREADEAPVTTAVREVEEESGLVLDPRTLAPRGYERFRPDASTGQGLWVPGRDILQVYATTLRDVAPPLRPEAAGHPVPQWVDDGELARRCGAAFWWPLAAYVLGVSGATAQPGLPG
jgi:8-oxo-dGTP pyrophosphatase MutT (NUDIX family)